MEVVLIVLAVVIVALICFALVRKQRERRLEGRREEAGELRQTARSHQLEAEAGEHERRAADLDPDVDDAESVTERGALNGNRAEEHPRTQGTL